MPKERMWYDVRTEDDAPKWYPIAEKRIWAEGYNAAVTENIRQLDEFYRRETGDSL